MYIKHLLPILISLVFTWASAQTPAFPGAEGHGRYVTGGRGGNVYYVSSLNDNISEQGTLRWALNQPSPKTILFKVSGTIMLNSQLKISKGDVTIAGQSAPGEGICIANHPVSVNANNVIVRYLRFRMGDSDLANADGADAFGSRDYSDVIIDHCSVSWSTDECASFYGMTNFSMQWCLISESLRLSGHSKGPHGYGGIWGGKNATFHHNLMAHHDSRTPRFGPAVSTQTEENVDYRNNVIYNWGGNGAYGGEAMNINVVNNYYKPGPATPNGSKRARILAYDKKTDLPTSDGFYPINHQWGALYVSGNVVDNSTSEGSDITHCNNATNNNWTYGIYNQIHSKYSITSAEKEQLKRSAPYEAGWVTTHTAVDAYDKVLAYAGASKARDRYDARIIEETRNGTAPFKGRSEHNGKGTEIIDGVTINWKSVGYPHWGIIDSHYDIRPTDAGATWTPWPILTSAASPEDSDKDGIPDVWEVANGLDANDPLDGKELTQHAAYTNLEMYLNSLVASITSQQQEGGQGGTTRLAHQSSVPIAIHPNPTTNQLTISGNLPMQSITIYNQSGVNCQSHSALGSTASALVLSPLSPGIYFVRVNF
ncbi:MAG: T9SS type A sorting domain-containing protein, partial [Bacteroidales bacterium]|nr:T9SS type A sorting domain-containing protein [Bacteroidales bacterium]